MKTCLVLEGGALRGIYTAGVLDELMKENIKIDTIIGVSMGALIGINYVSNQPKRALRYNLKYSNDKRYISLNSFIKTGNIVNKEFAYYKLPEELDKFDYDTFNKSKTKMICVVTNVETGKAEYIEIKDSKEDVEYLRATSAMPGVSKIIKINNKLYLDGGISDSIPIKYALSKKYDKIIVVTTRCLEYRKEIKKNKLFNLIYRKYPNFVNTINNRPIEYNKTLEDIIELEKQNKIFVIRPSKKINIKRLEKNNEIIKTQYNLGVKDFKNKLKDLKKYLR